MQELQKLAELDVQVQHDGQVAAFALQVCCCRQTMMLPAAPSAWGYEVQKLMLQQQPFCESLLWMWKLMVLHGPLHKHKALSGLTLNITACFSLGL